MNGVVVDLQGTVQFKKAGLDGHGLCVKRAQT